MIDTSNTAIIAFIGALTTIFVVGAIYGRLHQSKSDEPIKAVGDRVVSGLLALPLISFLIFSVVPEIHIAWAFLAPLPLAWYVILLAGTDIEWSWCLNEFTKYLLLGFGFIYLLWSVAFIYL